MVRAIAGDDLVLPRNHAGDLECRFVGLGAAGGEKEFLQPFGQHLQQFGAQASPRRGRVSRRHVRQFSRLGGLEPARTFILKALEETYPVAYNTVLTILRILTDKHYVKPRQDGRAFIYKPAVSKAEDRSRAQGHQGD